MLFADCPFCDAPAPVDETTGALACDSCALVLGIEDEPAQVELAQVELAQVELAAAA